MRRLVGGAAVAVLLLAGCGSGKGSGASGSTVPSTETPATVDIATILTSASSKTIAAKTADVSISIKTTGGATQGLGQFGGTGAFDLTGHRGVLTISVLGQSIQGVYDGTTIYEKIPQLAGQMGGKDWLKIDLNQAGKMIGVNGLGSLAQSEQSDPTAGLNYLRGISGPITTVGRELVRGVQTTHYQATADLNKAAANAPADQRATLQQIGRALGVTTVPMDVWVDDQGMVRRVHETIDYSKINIPNVPAGALPKTLDLTIEFYNFGVPVSVTVPPASQVVDVSQLLQGTSGPNT